MTEAPGVAGRSSSSEVGRGRVRSTAPGRRDAEATKGSGGPRRRAGGLQAALAAALGPGRPAREPSQGQSSRLRARPPPSARRPRSRCGDRGGRAARGPARADGRALARAGSRGAEQPPRREALAQTPATCQCAPGWDGPRGAPGGEGRGLRGLGHPHPPASSSGFCSEGSHFPPLSPPAGRARRQRALGPGAAQRPLRLPPGARVSAPGHSPPQLSVLCSPAGNDLRKRLGQGLRQAARAQRGDVLRSHLPMNYGWKQIRKSQFCMSPFSGGETRPAAGREPPPPLASAAAGRGMVRRKVAKRDF
nr:PREDICTED: collagen alpha-1(III) chain-like [Equus przewalskii]